MIRSPHSFAVQARPRCRAWRIILKLAPSIAFLTLLSGCNRLRHHAKPEMVYVVAEQTYLRDRVAPVSIYVARVDNGEALQVVEHSRRFFKVKTAKGEVGWIEEHLVIEQPTYDQFIQLQEQHRHDPVVATGVLRDNYYLHLKPGRDTERFYLLPENDRLQLLVRASVPKLNPGAVFVSSPKPSKPHGKSGPGRAERRAESVVKDAPTVPMEDWWLVRDKQGKVGWLMARRLDVDVPDEIAAYSEGQKMVGAYVLSKVYDPGSSFPDKQAPIYLAVLNAYVDGLPYDFNQIRVFTWNVKKHRYETAYRQRDLEGHLPVEVTREKIDHGDPVPVFTIHVTGSAASPAAPPQGAAQPAGMETLRFALEGNMVKKIFPVAQQTAPAPAHKHSSQRRIHSRSSEPRHHRATARLGGPGRQSLNSGNR